LKVEENIKKDINYKQALQEIERLISQ
jgi:hypothetical protein